MSRTLIKNPFSVLGVDRTTPLADVKRAYLRLACQFHPDRNPGNKAAEDKFKDINLSWEILSDPAKRTQIEQQLWPAQSPQQVRVIFQHGFGTSTGTFTGFSW